MYYIHAVLLLHKANKEITEENLKNVLQAAGVEVDEAKIKAIISALQGVDIEEAIKQGVALQAAPAQAAEEKKEEKKEEEKKEQPEATAGLAALFG